MASKVDGRSSSVIAKDSFFEGTFNVENSIEIHGCFEGILNVKGQVIIGETGRVKTKEPLVAGTVIIAGTFIGDIKAEDQVVLLNSCKIKGNITSPVLQVEKGVLFEGHLTIFEAKDYKKLGEEIENSYGESIKELNLSTED